MPLPHCCALTGDRPMTMNTAISNASHLPRPEPGAICQVRRVHRKNPAPIVSLAERCMDVPRSLRGYSVPPRVVKVFCARCRAPLRRLGGGLLAENDVLRSSISPPIRLRRFFMSGHSKWSSIKHKKAAKDSKRGKLFTKMIKEITVAARMGGGDINANPRLRSAVLTARENSMPNENIERAIKRGTGEGEGVTYEDVQYEGYGPGGVAIMATALTDNRNRTVAELRKLFEKCGGNMGSAGCVAWMFHKRGVLSVEKSVADEEKVMEVALEAGAEDVTDAGDIYEIITAPDTFEAVKNALQAASVATATAEVTMVPQNTVAVSGKEAEQTLRLLEELDDHDDVQSVSSNADISQDEMERQSA